MWVTILVLLTSIGSRVRGGRVWFFGRLIDLFSTPIQRHSYSSGDFCVIQSRGRRSSVAQYIIATMESAATLQVTWHDIDAYCQQIFEKIRERQFHPDIIVTPLRGGAIPAVILAHKFGLRKIITVDAQKTEDDSVDAKRQEVMIEMPATVTAIAGKNVLIVDEIFDTGDTLKALYEKVKEAKPHSILSAVIFSRKDKNIGVFTPDITLLQSDRWVVFPWETVTG